MACKKAIRPGIWNHTFLFFGFPTETRSEAQGNHRFSSGQPGLHPFLWAGSIPAEPGFQLLPVPRKVFHRTHHRRPGQEPIAMNLDFVANKGMSRKEAGEMNSQCIKMAEEFFPSLDMWGTLPREHFLLYLDKFGKEAHERQTAASRRREKFFAGPE